MMQFELIATYPGGDTRTYYFQTFTQALESAIHIVKFNSIETVELWRTVRAREFRYENPPTRDP